MAVRVLVYGSENWSLKRLDKRKFEAPEIRLLRQMAEYILWDKKIISAIREQLGTFIINEKFTQYKINWREQIQRIDDNRLPKKIKSQIWRKKKYRNTTNEMGK